MKRPKKIRKFLSKHLKKIRKNEFCNPNFFLKQRLLRPKKHFF